MSMTKAEKLELLSEWKERLRDLEASWDTLSCVTGADTNSPLGNSIWILFEAYTNAIGREIGDVENWMSWHWLENQLGERGHEAGNRNEMRPIKTLEDLLWAIELEDAQ